MVPLPLFKLAALFVRHISKYGAVSSAPGSPPTFLHTHASITNIVLAH